MAYKKLTSSQVDELISLYPYEFNKDIAKTLGVSLRTLVRRARELGLQKAPDFLEKRGRDIQNKAVAALRECHFENPYQFKKGVRNNPQGEFKKGHRLDAETEERRISAIRERSRTDKIRIRYGLKPVAEWNYQVKSLI